jgi:hypothetical protein
MTRPASVIPIVVPRGRSKAEKRIQAIAALHQPVEDRFLRGHVCLSCSKQWPCSTARLLGAWPGEDDET